MKQVLRFLALAALICVPWVTQAQQAIPYSYGFEDDDLSADGWTTQLEENSSGIYENAAHNGTYGFLFSFDETEGYLLSPVLTGTTNGVALSFYYKEYDDYYGDEQFYVGYTTDENNTDPSTYTYGSIVTASLSWQLYEITFPANTKRVAIKYVYNNAYYLFLDDFTFSAPSSCVKPTSLTVSDITSDQATISWTENGTAESWQYSLNDGEPVTVTTNPYTITGLTALTSYTIKLRADCGGSQSEYTAVQNFSTTAVATAVGDSWSDDFEGATCGWELINGTCADAWAWGTATNNGGTHALYVSDDNGTTYEYSHNSIKVFAAKLLSFADAKYEFSYDWTAKGESNYDFLRVALVPASQTLTAGSDYSSIGATSLPSGWIALDGGSKLNLQETWQHKSVTINNVAAGNYYMVFAWRSDNSTIYTPPAAVDNVSITRIACSYDVADLAVTPASITTTGATLTWTAGDATQWQVAYSTSNTFEGATEETVSAATYAMTSLTPATNYFVRVRAYCGGTDYGAWSAPISFPTACEAVAALGYTENFDGTMVASAYTPTARTLPTCWNYINECTYNDYKYNPTIYYYSYTDYSHSTPNCLRFYSYYSSWSDYDPQPQYAILPEMTGLAGKQVTLWAKGYSATSTFKIGTMSDPTDASTFAPITEQALTSSYQEFEYIIPATTDAYLAIMIDAANSTRSTNGVYIDDISINNPPTCRKPSGLMLNTPSDRTAHTATLKWTNGEAGQDAWQIAYSTSPSFAPAADFIPNGTTEWLADADANPFILTGLDANTDYYAYVRADCGSTDGVSAWSVANAHFKTVVGNSTPTGLAVDNSTITSSAATVNWTGVATNDYHQSFDIYYSGLSTRPEPLEADSLIEGLTDASYAFTHLEPEKKYYVWVRDNCGADGLSAWSNRTDFTTASDCQTPDGLAATNVSSNSATITWNTYGQTEFNLRYSADEGAHWIDVNNVAQPYILDGVLTANTAYQVQVQPATCSSTPEWSDELTFSTPCEAITITADAPYIQDFEDPVTTATYNTSTVADLIVPACWDNYYNTGSSNYYLPHIIKSDAGTSYNFSSPASQVLFFYGANGYAIMPEFSNDLSGLQISFKWAVESKSYGTLTLGYITDEDNGTCNTFQTIQEFASSTATAAKTMEVATVYLGGVPATAAHLVFRWSGTGYYYCNIDDIKVSLITKDITANSWYAISSPVHNSGNDETFAGVDNLDDGTYDLLGYDEANAAWKIPGGDLERGKGYIYRNAADKTLTFNGTANSGNIDVTLTATDAAGTMKGWNLLGNPYAHTYALTRDCYSLSTNGTWTVHDAGSYTMAVAEAVLVKSNGETFHFTETPSTKSAPASTIAFTVSNDEFTDIAYARFSSEEGLPKISHLNPEAPMLSIDGYAIANLNEGTESFPMSFSGQGSYTLTVSGNTDVTGYLHLVDRLTGRDIDLLSTPSYSFTGSPVSDRFTVKLTPDANEGNSTSRFAIFDGNSLIVNGEGTLEVYDVMGRRLMSAEVTGSEYRISGSDLHTGVYVLRMNGNSQKIVIK